MNPHAIGWPEQLRHVAHQLIIAGQRPDLAAELVERLCFRGEQYAVAGKEGL